MTESPFATPETSGVPLEPTKAAGCGFMGVLVVIAIVVVLIGLILPNLSRGVAVRGTVLRMKCGSNVEHILMALHEYHHVHKAFPPALTVDTDGKPLHSWRTLILPFLEQEQLYDSIDLTKPWNDPVNAKALRSIPPVYRCPGTKQSGNTTTYLAVVGEKAFLHPSIPRSLLEITDGTSNTLAVIEATLEDAVPWMSPQDADEETALTFNSHGTLVHAAGRSPGFTNAAFADGSVRILSADLPPETKRALVSIAGEDKVGEF